MIILITGSTHTGKTTLAQHLLERNKYPYLSIDHLKMGLIRSGHCPLTPENDDNVLTEFLWPIVREIIRTNIENGQNLIVEGCYIPFSWHKDFTSEYMTSIRFICLVMSDTYILNHFEDIQAFANITEKRLPGNTPSQDELIAENRANLMACNEYGLPYVLIDEEYEIGYESIIGLLP